jgi:hypothetical protein
MNALKYGRSWRVDISGKVLRSYMTVSNSAWSFFATSTRRLSSQHRYESVVDVVSQAPTLYGYKIQLPGVQRSFDLKKRTDDPYVRI